MGLKIATLQFTNRFGGVENALLIWAGADINYGRAGSVRFAVFENADEWARGNQKATFVLPITEAEVLAMFQRIGNVALEISDASWDLAATTKFIPSRVINDETGEPETKQFSLTDLRAEITDIGLPEGFKTT